MKAVAIAACTAVTLTTTGYLPRICATCLGVASITDTEGQA